jgi:hypothetical protein
LAKVGAGEAAIVVAVVRDSFKGAILPHVREPVTSKLSTICGTIRKTWLQLEFRKAIFASASS